MPHRYFSMVFRAITKHDRVRYHNWLSASERATMCRYVWKKLLILNWTLEDKNNLAEIDPNSNLIRVLKQEKILKLKIWFNGFNNSL